MFFYSDFFQDFFFVFQQFDSDRTIIVSFLGFSLFAQFLEFVGMSLTELGKFPASESSCIGQHHAATLLFLSFWDSEYMANVGSFVFVHSVPEAFFL